MNECNSNEVANTYPKLSNHTKLRLNEINKIRNSTIKNNE